ETHLEGQQFSWLTTIFYETPGNYLVQKFHVGRFLGICIFIWGIIVLCIGFADNLTELIILRFLQGTFESTISPAFLSITGSVYITKKHTLRAAIWGTANAGMNAITGLINYGIGDAANDPPSGLSAWHGIAF
ncbi:uncharacterized protein MYCFIDRAFT_32229, partial [Pseudocercospora fijiensis CIRAD86]